jgi:hypothetical protein
LSDASLDDGTHLLWTATGDWQQFHQVVTTGAVTWVQSNGTLVWAGSEQRQQIVVSSDAGQSWQRLSPG